MRRALFPAAMLAAAMFAASATTAAETTQRTLVFGSEAVVTVRDVPTEQANAAIARVFALFEDMHARFYPWREGELRRLNARIAAGSLPVTVSADMAAMLRLALLTTAQSEGLFNPAIGGLVTLWGFTGERVPTAPPSDAAVRDFLQKRPPVDFLTLRGRVVSDASASAVLDFGGLAKGSALDAAARALRADGVSNALVNVGGNILAMGENDGRAWRVALQPRRDRPPLAVLNLRDGEAVATSGDGNYFYEYEGRRFHHILDPRSGRPAVNAHAAIVVSDDATAAGAMSDALATALVIADDETALRLAANFQVSLFWRRGVAGEQVSAAMRRRLREPR